VPRSEAVLRFSMNARHTREDLDLALDALERATTTVRQVA
jgi:hypothetical protein